MDFQLLLINKSIQDVCWSACVRVGLRNQGRVRVVKTYLEYTSMENDYYRRKLVILQLDCSNRVHVYLIKIE